MFFINPFIYGGAGGDYESIATVTVGSGGAAAIEFTSIPGTYQHLQLRGISRISSGTVQLALRLRVNGDTASNYASHILYGDGSSAGAAAVSSTASTIPIETIGASALSSSFAAFVCDVLDYSVTTKNTTIRALSGSDANGSGQVRIGSALWTSTAAVTSLSLDRANGETFAQHSQVALYGIRA